MKLTPENKKKFVQDNPSIEKWLDGVVEVSVQIFDLQGFSLAPKSLARFLFYKPPMPIKHIDSIRLLGKSGDELVTVGERQISSVGFCWKRKFPWVIEWTTLTDQFEENLGQALERARKELFHVAHYTRYIIHIEPGCDGKRLTLYLFPKGCESLDDYCTKIMAHAAMATV